MRPLLFRFSARALAARRSAQQVTRLTRAIPLHRQLGAQHHRRGPLGSLGRGRFAPTAREPSDGPVNPRALAMLTRNHLPTEGLRSKSWMSSRTPEPSSHFGSPFVTVPHKRSARLAGATMTAHWGIEDPAVVEAPMRRRSARSPRFRELDARLKIFTSLSWKNSMGSPFSDSSMRSGRFASQRLNRIDTSIKIRALVCYDV